MHTKNTYGVSGIKESGQASEVVPAARHSATGGGSAVPNVQSPKVAVVRVLVAVRRMSHSIRCGKVTTTGCSLKHNGTDDGLANDFVSIIVYWNRLNRGDTEKREKERETFKGRTHTSCEMQTCSEVTSENARSIRKKKKKKRAEAKVFVGVFLACKIGSLEIHPAENDHRAFRERGQRERYHAMYTYTPSTLYVRRNSR
jgi:hypothetical protein